MMRSLPELQKPLEDSVQMSGREMELSLTPSLQGCGTANPLVCMCDLDSMSASRKET